MPAEPTTRVFVGSEIELGETISLPAEERSHVFKVLRGRTGDRIEVVDRRQRLLVAELLDSGEASVVGELASAEEPAGSIALYQAVPKGRNMDTVVEKATELGVTRIIPLFTERSVARPSGEGGKVDRWRRVAEAASRQSLQLRVPELCEPAVFLEVAASYGAGSTGIVLHNGPGLPEVEDALSGLEPEAPLGLFVGPEGGWSERELEAVEGGGLRLAQLGPYRLRSETAGIVAVSRAETGLRRARKSRGDRPS
ncbi:MAG: 16S rRNA (uracil(1498)-N(3))-methyltransferase [Rubrobacter sp.]|nr:16S rRNA (uracil(1498)-N(3))-methyltransferase [Rubrobacter sp.]